MFGVYSKIRVMDVSRILVGPYATVMLSDLRAEVIKVESFEVVLELIKLSGR
jgi:crotonobetainyl-CoA:carnitine CoA-transferase CaiB-like acyl-CoA transferase